MNSFMTRVVTAATVGLLAVSFAAPSFAQTRAKRHAAPMEQGEYYVEQNAQSAHPGAPASVANQPNACFTDEGYGRYAACDQGGN
jgi:H+/gluconate symporter-like permease